PFSARISTARGRQSNEKKPHSDAKPVALGVASSAIVDLALSIAFPAMKEIRLKVSDLFEIESQTAERPKEFAAITDYVLKHYGFLPKPIAVTVENDEVVISYPEEPDAKREEAARLAGRAVKRASEGQYEKAIGRLARNSLGKLWKLSLVMRGP